MKRAALVLLLACTQAHACLNDRDTNAIESRNSMEFMDVLAGRFERNPPLYYEMRIKRLIPQTQRQDLSRAEKLPLFDDIAVAYERLGDHDRAIQWIRKKEPIAEIQDKEMVYSYHANLGTFIAHKWFEHQDLGLGVLANAASHIKAALAINPDAHFGREAVQLYLMRESLGEDSSRPYDGEPDQDAKVQKGLLGLMTLGSAWQSKLVWQHVGSTFDFRNESGLMELAYLRVRALEKPDAPLQGREGKMLKLYRALTQNGEKWHKHRTEFMLAKLKTGRHPDWDKTFWDGYIEVPRVDTGSDNSPGLEISMGLFALFLVPYIGPAAYVTVIVWLIVRAIRRRTRVS